MPASSARAWAQLARVPNLFSIPGDPLAGYLLKTRLWEQAQAFRVADKPAPAAAAQIYDDLQELLIAARDLVQVLAADLPMPEELAIRVGQWTSSVNRLVGQG